MVKVGDKVVVIKTNYVSDDFQPGCILTVSSFVNEPKGVRCENRNGILRFFGIEGDSECHATVRPYTESEAEKRGAKFGALGTVKATGESVVFVKEHRGEWRVFDENGIDYDFTPSKIRLDHEPEFVAWSEAPEHLRYDASRVYFDGKPVKWIAKPEGSVFDVVFVGQCGWVECGGKNLTVKL